MTIEDPEKVVSALNCAIRIMETNPDAWSKRITLDYKRVGTGDARELLGGCVGGLAGMCMTGYLVGDQVSDKVLERIMAAAWEVIEYVEDTTDTQIISVNDSARVPNEVIETLRTRVIPGLVP